MCCQVVIFQSWTLRAVFRVFVWKIIEKTMKKLIFFSSNKSYNFSPDYSILAIFGQVIGKTETKNKKSVGNRFLRFWDFSDFCRPKNPNFWLFQDFRTQDPEKSGKKSKNRKSVSYRFFVLFLPITWPKMAKIELTGHKL